MAQDNPRPYFRGSSLANSNRVFSGVDVAAIAIYGDRLVELGNCTTVSYSIYREKYPVRRLGRSYPAGYTRGMRTVGGSLVFVNFNQAALGELFDLFKYDEVSAVESLDLGIVTDQLPPFDILLFFRGELNSDVETNPTASLAEMRLIGVEIATEGGVFGVDEVFTETTMQFVANGISLLKPVTTRKVPSVTTPGAFDYIIEDRELSMRYEQATRPWFFQNDPNDKLIFNSQLAGAEPLPEKPVYQASTSEGNPGGNIETIQ